MKPFRIIIILLSVLAVLTAGAGYKLLFGSGVIPSAKSGAIIIPTGSSYNQVLDSITRHVKINNPGIFKLVSEKKKYPSHIKPGRYVVNKSMSYVAFVNMLRSGNQSPVKVTFNNIRTIYQLAGKVGKQIEADSASIASYLDNEKNFSEIGLKHETIISVFIPDTYEFYFNTTPQVFFKRMYDEYLKFWNDERQAKAKGNGLTPLEVSTLASIIDDEVRKPEEKPRIAGVYLNRLRRGMPLQACPTIKFAMNDFTITRILTKYLQVDSPYNTYKNKGLPPGPIGCPTRESLEAVLNAENHDYLFFVARADFSGYHNFSKTLAEHNRYAAEYQKELDKRKIYR